jgi:hypothetical protein
MPNILHPTYTSRILFVFHWAISIHTRQTSLGWAKEGNRHGYMWALNPESSWLRPSLDADAEVTASV